MNPTRMKHFPIWTVVLTGVAFIAVVPGAVALFQYDRAALAAGQWWRGITGHWAHWSADHLFWDAATFAALGMLAEVRSRKRFVLCVAGSCVTITAGLWFRPGVEFYRGLSGIDSALFVLVAAGLLRDAAATRGRFTAVAASAALTGFVLKVAWEVSTGSALFVNDSGAGFECVPLAHALGAAVGLPLGLWARRPSE
jgi:rhomboid family GlyGly-CTERM serine protease